MCFKNNGYTVVCALSEDLAAIVGKPYMQRSAVVKAMWAYFRENQLMDPKVHFLPVVVEPEHPLDSLLYFWPSVSTVSF